MTQEQVAELVELSNPHISNIERGTTKMSLPTLVAIANVLEVSADELLCDSLEHSEPVYHHEIAKIMEDCSSEELRALTEILKAVKETLRKVYPKE